MEYGVNVLSVLPVRKEADHRSEMVNQLLFGEQFIVTEETEGWLHIKSALDNYSGWITSGLAHPLNQLPLCGDPDPEEIISQAMRVSPLDSPENSFLILPGSSLPGLDREKGEFNMGGIKYKAHGSFTEDTGQCSAQKLVQSALLFLNAPYMWGGRSLFGMDCSGLVQLAYKICGISLPRDAGQQVLRGEARSFASEAQAGELAFFAKHDEDISHVGMILEKGTIIHASGKVRIDSFDHQGIFNVEKKDYTHFLRVIHRYLPE